MKKVWEGIKKFLSTLTAQNIKDLAKAALIIVIIIAILGVYNAFKQKIRNDERAKVAEELATNLKIENNSLKLANAGLDTDVKNRDIKIGILQKEVLDTRDERDEIKTRYNNFRSSFVNLSQEGKDKELTELFKKNNIDMAVVAADNYIKIIPEERNELYVFASTASECFELNLNLTKEKDNLQTQFNLCSSNVIDLNKKIENNNKICENEKLDLNNKLTNMTNQKNTWRRNAFWSKTAGIAATVLVILLLK